MLTVFMRIGTPTPLESPVKRIFKGFLLRPLDFYSSITRQYKRKGSRSHETGTHGGLRLGGALGEGIGLCRLGMGSAREWLGVRRDGRRAVTGCAGLIRGVDQSRRNGLYVRTSSLDLSIPIKQNWKLWLLAMLLNLLPRYLRAFDESVDS